MSLNIAKPLLGGTTAPLLWAEKGPSDSGSNCLNLKVNEDQEEEISAFNSSVPPFVLSLFHCSDWLPGSENPKSLG